MGLILTSARNGFNRREIFFLETLKPFLASQVSTLMHPIFGKPFIHLGSDAALRDADVVKLVEVNAMDEAFALLLGRYETKVFHLCVAMLGEPAQAQDVAQDSLLRIWRSLASYDAQRAALSTWIYAITRNRCLTELGQRHRDEHSIELPGIREEVECVTSEQPLNDAASVNLLHQLIDTLPPTQRQCLKLYYFEEHSVGDVATMLALPQGTVKTHLHRARGALQQALQSRGLARASLWL